MRPDHSWLRCNNQCFALHYSPRDLPPLSPSRPSLVRAPRGQSPSRMVTLLPPSPLPPLMSCLCTTVSSVSPISPPHPTLSGLPIAPAPSAHGTLEGAHVYKSVYSPLHQMPHVFFSAAWRDAPKPAPSVHPPSPGSRLPAWLCLYISLSPPFLIVPVPLCMFVSLWCLSPHPLLIKDSAYLSVGMKPGESRWVLRPSPRGTACHCPPATPHPLSIPCQADGFQ
jgi:hypothetical protein